MASTFTPNINLEMPARNDYLNQWDIPVNGNTSALDGKIGGTTSIALTNANVALTPAQALCSNLIFTGALTGNVVASLPVKAAGIYSVLNGTTGAFTVILNTVNGGAALVLPQGIRALVMCDGTNVYLSDQALPPGIPLPWLSPNIPGGFILGFGQVLNQADQPGIYSVYGTRFNKGGETGSQFRMPDLRGVCFVGLDNMGGVARGLLTAIGGGTTIGATGGEQSHQLSVAELASHGHGVGDPGHAHGVADPGHSHPYTSTANQNSNLINNGSSFRANVSVIADNTGASGTGIGIYAAGTGISIGATGSNAAHNNLQPSMLGNWIVKT